MRPCRASGPCDSLSPIRDQSGDSDGFRHLRGNTGLPFRKTTAENARAGRTRGLWRVPKCMGRTGLAKVAGVGGAVGGNVGGGLGRAWP